MGISYFSKWPCNRTKKCMHMLDNQLQIDGEILHKGGYFCVDYDLWIFCETDCSI